MVTVTRGPSDDATLSSLSLVGVGAIILTPAFDPATTGYTAEVANTVETISLTAPQTNDGASVSIVDADGASIPDTAQIDLEYGENIISITVTAQDGTTTLNYQVKATRAFAWHTTLTVGERLTAIPHASGYTTWGEDMGSLSTEQDTNERDAVPRPEPHALRRRTLPQHQPCPSGRLHAHRGQPGLPGPGQR